MLSQSWLNSISMLTARPRTSNINQNFNLQLFLPYRMGPVKKVCYHDIDTVLILIFLFRFRDAAIVRLRVHFSRHCDFNQLSD